MNFRANMASLRTLSDDHYQNRISFLQYREQRSHLLKRIDEDLNGVKIDEEVNLSEEVSVIEKALSFLKFNNIKETN